MARAQHPAAGRGRGRDQPLGVRALADKEASARFRTNADWLDRDAQPRVVATDPFVELAQLGTRFDAHFGERDARALIGTQRFDLTAGAVQREHQQRAQMLPVRLFLHQTLQRADGHDMAARRQLGGQARFDRRQSQLVEANGFELQARNVANVLQCGPAPLIERSGQDVRGVTRIILEHLGAAAGHRLEPMHVDLGRIDAHFVASGAPPQHRGAASGFEYAAQAAHMCLHRRARTARWRAVPQFVFELICRHASIRTDEKQCEQGAGFGTGNGYWAPIAVLNRE